MSATLSVSQSLMVFNAVRNSTASPTETLTLTNTGDAALSLNGLSVVNDPNQTNQGAARFSLLNAGSAPASLAVGASFTLQVNYSATATGLDYALLNLSSSDPNHTLEQVQLHGIGTAGLGGANQPSLQRILQAYNETNYNQVGETDSTSAYYPEPPASNTTEVPLQELVKAGTGPVTINVLASFTGASTKPYTLGWYNVASPTNTKQQLFYTPTAESQSVYVQPQGLTSFDPGSTVFGLYNPSATVRVNSNLVTGYSQDSLNTWDTTDARKFRFFPLKDSNGTVVPNSYIVTSTEWYNPSGYDFTNMVAIISNVTAAPSAPAGPVLSITNPNQLAGSNTLIFNRIQNPNTTVGDTVHDSNTITLENTGQGNLTVSNISVAATSSSNGGTQYQLVNAPAFPFTLTAGQTQTIQVQFILSQANANGHSLNETNSAGGGGGGSVYPGVLTITTNDGNAATTTIPLAGWWQQNSENENEPSLQSMVNLLAGYSTEINPSQVSFLTESTATGSTPTYYGEEVVSAYWAAADSTLPVGAMQLAAYHTEGDTSGLNYYLQGSTTVHTVLGTGSDVGQTFFPLNGAGTATAAGSFSTTSNFGLETLNPNAYSDDAKNAGAPGGGHMIRYYPVRDATGNLVPNTYIMACDYPNGAAENFDFQDNVYLVTNIRPVSTNTVSVPQTTGGAAAPAAVSATQVSAGISLQWVPVIDPTITSYKIYSSLSSTTGYTLLATTSAATASYLDTAAMPGETVYYRVAAVNSIGAGLGAQTSVITSGTASTNLQTIAIGETPSGSTNTITPNQAYNVVAGGPGVGGTSDGFRYLFATQTGNFDVAVQVITLTVAGNFSTAGIMARDSLDAGGANAYMSASPTNYRFKYRTIDSGTESVTTGTGSPTYPNVWVRLKRVGNVFNGYTSTDGVIWTLMSQQTLANFPTTCYLGLAVASNTTTSTTTAQLAHYGTTSLVTGPVAKPDTYTAVSGQTVQETVLSNDVDPTGTIQPGSFTITTPPNAGGSATFDSTTGLLTYTSAAGFVGTETLSYTVADNNSVTSSPATITFNVLSSRPVAAADTFQTVAGQSTQLQVLTNDTDAANTLNPSSVQILSQPGSGATVTVDAITGVITYLAPTTFSGTDTFTYGVSDYAGQSSTPATVTITVAPAPVGALTTGPTTTTAVAGTATIINVLADDTDTAGSILPGTVLVVSNPSAGGIAQGNSDGTITYTAAADFAGVETFMYTVRDNAGTTSVATLVTATVTLPIPPPLATSTTSTAMVNGSLTVNVAGNVSSVAGLDLSTVAVSGAPQHGTTSIDATTGVITYTPAQGFVGPDSFTYTVADTNGKTSNTATLAVNVGLSVGTGAGDDKSVTFTSASGAITTLSLNHGSVQVLFNNDATVSVDRSGRATISGLSLQISDLVLTNTITASTLSVVSKGNGIATIGGLSASGAIKTISAPKAILSGVVNLAGIASLQVAQVSNAQITIGAGVPSGFSLTAGAVSDTTLTSAVPIRALKATTWTGSTASASSIVAPSIGTLSVAGNFQPTLTLSDGGMALNSAQIKGAIGSTAWDVAGNVGTINAGSVSSDLHASIVGAINNFTIHSGGMAGTLAAGSLNTLTVTGGITGRITAGTTRTIHVIGNVQGATLNFTAAGTSLNTLSVSGAITGTSLIVAGNVGTIAATLLEDDTILIGSAPSTTLANVTASTIGSATLKSLHLTSRGPVTFSDTTLIVHSLTAATLGVVDTSTANGVAVVTAKSITGTENGTQFRFTAASTTSALFGEFEIDLVTAS